MLVSSAPPLVSGIILVVKASVRATVTPNCRPLSRHLRYELLDSFYRLLPYASTGIMYADQTVLIPYFNYKIGLYRDGLRFRVVNRLQ